MLLPSLFDSNRIICSLCIRSLIRAASHRCVRLFAHSCLSLSFCSFLLPLSLSSCMISLVFVLLSSPFVLFELSFSLLLFEFFGLHPFLSISPSLSRSLHPIRKKSKVCARFFFGCTFLVFSFFLFLLLFCCCCFYVCFILVAIGRGRGSGSGSD